MYSTVQEQVYNTTWVSGVPPGQYFLPEPAPSEPAPLTASNWGPMEPRAPVPGMSLSLSLSLSPSLPLCVCVLVFVLVGVGVGVHVTYISIHTHTLHTLRS